MRYVQTWNVEREELDEFKQVLEMPGVTVHEPDTADYVDVKVVVEAPSAFEAGRLFGAMAQALDDNSCYSATPNEEPKRLPAARRRR